jgi:hypothetical protein
MIYERKALKNYQPTHFKQSVSMLTPNTPKPFNSAACPPAGKAKKSMAKAKKPVAVAKKVEQKRYPRKG